MPHGCCHRLILFFLNSQASRFSSCFVFNPAVLILVPSPLACSFCLSAGDVCSACQRAFTRVPCLLLSGHSVLLCCSANAELNRDAVYLSFFFLIFIIISWLIFCLVVPPPCPFFHTDPTRNLMKLFRRCITKDVLSRSRTKPGGGSKKSGG